MPLERVFEDLQIFLDANVKLVKFVDRTFNLNENRYIKIWEYIKNHYNGITRFHFEIAGDILKESTLEILQSMPEGAVQLEIGMQSFNEKTLAYINRKTNTEKLIENIRKLLAPGNLHIHIDLIAGLPFEDLESFEHSFDIGYNLRSNMLQLGFLKLLHGAQMRENFEKYPCEFSKEPPYEVISTQWTSEEDLSLLHKVEDALERLCNSGRFIGTVDYILEETGLSPFEFFKRFGIYAAEHSKPLVSLDDYTEMAFEYLSKLDGIEASVLKDKMICDRLCSNSSGKLPEVLKVRNPEIKKIRLAIESEEENRPYPVVFIKVITRHAEPVKTSTTENEHGNNQHNPKFRLVDSAIPFRHHLCTPVGQATRNQESKDSSDKRAYIRVAGFDFSPPEGGAEHYGCEVDADENGPADHGALD